MNKQISELKNRLRHALTIRNMKPIELSEKTGISKSAISQYMSGYAIPKADRVYLISKALNIRESWLLGFDTDMEPTTHTAPPAPLELTEKERLFVERYRQNPAMQPAVDRLLGISDTSGSAATLADDLAQEIDALQSLKRSTTK